MRIPLRNLRLDNPALRWEGAVEMEWGPDGADGPQWVMPWRVRRDWKELYPPNLLRRGWDAAGTRLSIVGNVTQLVVGIDPFLEREPVEACTHWTFDLYIDGKLHERKCLARHPDHLTFTGWSAGGHRYELYCDIRSPVRFTSVAVDADATLDALPDDRPRWLVYGSSITQCGSAAGPGETWPAIVARRLELNHMNLGYGGQALLEPAIARMIASLPADLISVCLSVNNYTAHTPRSWRSLVIGFLESIRDGHPETPVVCVSPIWSEPREKQPSSSGLTLEYMREQACDAVAVLRALGDGNLHYIDGHELFGPDLTAYIPDRLHPDAEGYRILATRYAHSLRRLNLAGIGKALRACDASTNKVALV
jgi:hypothetical protein